MESWWRWSRARRSSGGRSPAPPRGNRRYRHIRGGTLTGGQIAATIRIVEKIQTGEDRVKGHVRPALPSGLTGVASRRGALLGILAASALAWGTGSALADEAASLEHARQETPPSWAGPTTPAKAPAGIKVGIISCGAQFRGCQAPADAAFEAAKKIGWTPTMYDGAGTQDRK